MTDLNIQSGRAGVGTGGTTGDFDEKPSQHVIERTETGGGGEDVLKGTHHAMRAKADDLGIWEAMKRYKLVTAVGMTAAFAATLDGYREL